MRRFVGLSSTTSTWSGSRAGSGPGMSAASASPFSGPVTAWIVSSKAEADTGFIRVGAECTFQVDAFPNETFHGRVSAIRLNAYIVQNVVTYDTVIDFENPDERLLPGETAYVTISTGRADNATLVPNAAISFTPDLPQSEVQDLYRKYKIPPAAYTSHHGNEQVVWRMSNEHAIEPVAIRAGLSDSTSTQLLSGNIHAGDELLTGSLNSPAFAQQGRAPIPNRTAGGRR